MSIEWLKREKLKLDNLVVLLALVAQAKHIPKITNNHKSLTMKLGYYTIPLTLSVYVQYDLPFLVLINTLSLNLVESSSSLKWSLQQYFDVIQDSLHIYRSNEYIRWKIHVWKQIEKNIEMILCFKKKCHIHEK